MGAFHVKNLEDKFHELSILERSQSKKSYEEWAEEKLEAMKQRIKEEKEREKEKKHKSEKDKEHEKLVEKKYNDWLMKKHEKEIYKEQQLTEQLRQSRQKSDSNLRERKNTSNLRKASLQLVSV